VSDCSCLYDSGDGDQPSFHSRAWRKARKPHKCYECRRTIQPGELYEHFSGKWEHGIDTYSTCAECQNIRASLYCGQEWTFGCLWEDVEEQLFRETGLTVECIDKLTTPEAKHMLQQRWMQFVEGRA
jgi:hypothetical protein